MKNFLLSVCLVAGTAAMAQPIEFGFHFNSGLPMGEDFSNAAGFGLGGSVDINYYVNPQLSFGIEGGFLAFGAKSTTVTLPGFGSTTSETKLNMIPLLAKGTFYFLTGKARPYASLGVGYYLVNSTNTTTIEITGIPATTVEASGTNDGFGIRPELGLLYVAGNKVGISLGVGYNALFNSETVTSTDPNTGQTVSASSDPTNYLVINVGVKFKLDGYETGGFLKDYF